MEQPYLLPILYWQYHACWCGGDFRSQSISKHGIDPQSQNIPSPASEELIIYQPLILNGAPSNIHPNLMAIISTSCASIWTNTHMYVSAVQLGGKQEVDCFVYERIYISFCSKLCGKNVTN